MSMGSLEKEAEVCRALAKNFAGRSEEPFLFRLANALDEVAAMERQQSTPKSADEPLQNSVGPRWLKRGAY